MKDSDMGTTIAMDLYIVTKNDGPSSGPCPDRKIMLYIGESLEDAVGTIPNVFQRNGTDTERTKTYPFAYTVLPQSAKFEIIQFYSADGWWYSIAKMEF